MSLDTDIRNLAKWLNEEQTAPIDRPALARLLAWAQSANKPAAWVYPEFFERIEQAGCWTAYAGDGSAAADGVKRIPLYRGALTGGNERQHIICLCPDCTKPAQQQEPFGHVTVRRLSQRFENHADQYWFFPVGQSPYLDNVDEIHAVYTSPPASKPLDAVDGDVLPPIGSRVFIRHGRDNDAHACTVTGYYAWPAHSGDKHVHRVFVRMVYEGTDTQQVRLLCDCYPTEEAALGIKGDA